MTSQYPYNLYKDDDNSAQVTLRNHRPDNTVLNFPYAIDTRYWYHVKSGDRDPDVPGRHRRETVNPNATNQAVGFVREPCCINSYNPAESRMFYLPKRYK